MVLPTFDGSAVPCIFGVLSLVMPVVLGTSISLLSTLPTLSFTVVIAGAAGAVPSILKVRASVGADSVPALLVAVALTLYSPSINVSALATSKLHVPFAVTVVLPIWSPLIKTLITSPTSPVPLKVGLRSSVTASLATSPVTVP